MNHIIVRQTLVSLINFQKEKTHFIIKLRINSDI